MAGFLYIGAGLGMAIIAVIRRLINANNTEDKIKMVIFVSEITVLTQFKGYARMKRL